MGAFFEVVEEALVFDIWRLGVGVGIAVSDEFCVNKGQLVDKNEAPDGAVIGALSGVEEYVDEFALDEFFMIGESLFIARLALGRGSKADVTQFLIALNDDYVARHDFLDPGGHYCGEGREALLRW